MPMTHHAINFNLFCCQNNDINGCKVMYTCRVLGAVSIFGLFAGLSKNTGKGRRIMDKIIAKAFSFAAEGISSCALQFEFAMLKT